MEQQREENVINNRLQTPDVSVARVWAPGHDVQFYDDDAFLCVGVSQFLAEGVRAGQPIIVIATAAHRKEFAAQLRMRGIDPEELHPTDAVWLDARETLSAFMEGGHPNRELFEATVGNVFEKALTSRHYAVVRAYGEMVDLLWRDGKSDAALELEELWNGLASKYSFSLLCAYAKESFVAHARPDGVERICSCHSRVVPSRVA
jgi:hypothetical protein